MKDITLTGLSAVLISTAIAGIMTSAFKTEAIELFDKNSTAIAQASIPIASGSFVTAEKDHPTKGAAKIIELEGKRYLEIDESFTTVEGPDVQVVMYRGSTVPVNIEEKEYITIAPLQSFEGTQKYELPEDLSLDEYQSVAVWCRKFNVTFGYASLEQE